MLTRIGDWQRRGRFWHNLVTGRVIPVIAGGALPATDSFATGVDQNITAYSGNWSTNTGAIWVQQSTDDAYPNSASAESAVFWNADTFSANQYSQATCTANGSAVMAIGVGVRHAGAGVATYYLYYSDSSNSYLYKSVAGSFTQLGSNGTAFATSSVYRLEANGTTLTPKKDGATADIGSQSDSSISSGSAGLAGYNNGSSVRIDNWEGGDLSGTSTGATAPASATTAAETPWLDDNWTNTANIYGAGVASITAASYDNGDQSYVLKAYNFDFSAVPSGATIDGIVCVINARYAAGSASIDLVQLLDTSLAKVGTNLASTPQAVTGTLADYTFGGTGNTWGNSLTDTWVKNSNFGVAVGMIAGSNNTDVEIDSITLNVYYTAASGTNLTVNDASVVSQVDTVVLTKSDTLTVPDASVTTQADALTLTKSDTLTVADGFVTTQVDTPAVASPTVLTVNDAAVTTQTDGLTLTKSDTLAIADASVTTQADAVTLTKSDTLTIADASVVTQADAPTLTKSDTLTVADAAAVTQTDALTLTKSDTLAVAGTFVTTQTDAITLSGAGDLVVADASVTTQTDALTLTYSTTLTVADGFVTTQVDAPAVAAAAINLTVADTFVATQTDALGALVHSDTLTIADAFVTTQTDAVTLTGIGLLLTVADAHVGTFVDAPAVQFVPTPSWHHYKQRKNPPRYRRPASAPSVAQVETLEKPFEYYEERKKKK